MLLVDDFDRAPHAAAARTRLTPAGARFIKRARTGKNERFDPMQPKRGEAPLAGGKARSAPIRAEPARAAMRRFDPKCVRKHTIQCRYARRLLRQLRSAIRNIKLLLDTNEVSA